jgi:hypothetical protein
LDTGADGQRLAAGRVEPFSAPCSLARESYGRVRREGTPDPRDSELELLLRVLQSYQAVHRHLDANHARQQPQALRFSTECAN